MCYTVVMNKAIDIRRKATRKAVVDGGTLYQSGAVIQAYWDAGRGRETWTAPDVAQATSEFDSMVARW